MSELKLKLCFIDSKGKKKELKVCNTMEEIIKAIEEDSYKKSAFPNFVFPNFYFPQLDTNNCSDYTGYVIERVSEDEDSDYTGYVVERISEDKEF